MSSFIFWNLHWCLDRNRSKYDLIYSILYSFKKHLMIQYSHPVHILKSLNYQFHNIERFFKALKFSWVVDDHMIVFVYTSSTQKSSSLLWLLTWNVMSCILVLHDTLAQMRLQIFTPAYIIKCQNRKSGF